VTFGDRQRDKPVVTGGNLGGDRRDHRPTGQAHWPKGPAGVTTNRPPRQRVRPLPEGDTLFTPGASPARQATERRSARALVFLHQLPAWVAPIFVVVFLVAGLAMRGPAGAVALCGVAAVLGWLAALAWPRLSASGRLGRLAAVAVMLGVAAWQAAR
jgi:hypothetical protein